MTNWWFAPGELEQFVREIKSNCPGISPDEIAEAMTCFTDYTPDEREFFRQVRSSAPHVTYGWDIEHQAVLLHGIRFKMADEAEVDR